MAVASHHPVCPAAASILFGLWAALTFFRPGIWLGVLPATLPLMNFSPWTGWMVFEEFDLLVLGAIAGGYLRWALQAPPPGEPASARASWRSLPIIAMLLGATGVVALGRGLADAGPGFGWYDGYTDPLNSLRLFKPVGHALLLWPLLAWQLRASTSGTVRQFGVGMLLGLGVCTLAMIWERAALPGLWDWATPYRAVALFWEMHVGGAAIDAYLAMSLPFVAWALWSESAPARWAAAAALALAAAYACLMTFSRGVYLAAVAPMLLLGLALPIRRLGAEHRARLWRLLGHTGRVLLAGAVLVVALLAFGLAGAVALTVVLLAVLAGFGWRPGGWRHAAGQCLALVLVLEVVAVFGSGSFMVSRLAASHRDFGSRLEHWHNGLSLLHGPADWAFGIGLGRLPANYARFVPDSELSGSARSVDATPAHRAVSLAGPRTQGELGGLFALTQRVPLGREAAYQLAFDVRVLAPAELAASVCEMHLLYEGHCQQASLPLRPADGSWQHHVLALQGPPLGDSVVPRLRVFALSLLNAGAEVEIRNLSLTGKGTHNLLRNGDFERGLAHWWPAAQSYFVPWHIDNLYLELLIERGLVGWAVVMAVVGLALWNLLAGPARHQPIAPFLAASLTGALIVGLFGSLMDVPRVALLFLLLLLLALSLGDAGPQAAGAEPE